MFICDKCAPKMGVPEFEVLFFSRSYGRCEVCHETASCVDARTYGKPHDTPRGTKGDEGTIGDKGTVLTKEEYEKKYGTHIRDHS